MALKGIGPNRIVFGGERAGKQSLTMQRDSEGNVAAVTDGCYGLGKSDVTVLVEWLQGDEATWKRHLPTTARVG